MFTCARCGEPLTVPYFYQGAVYGWTCIGIVCPSRKKEARKFAKCAWFETLPIDHRGNLPFKCKLLGLNKKRFFEVLAFSQELGVYCNGDFRLLGDKLYVDVKSAKRHKIEITL